MYYLNDCNGTGNHNYLIRKQILNHLAIMSTYLHGEFGCVFLSCHTLILEWF